MEGSVHTIKENVEGLAVVGKEIGIEVNADTSKYMFMSRDQNAGRRVQIFGNSPNISKFYSGRN